MTINRAPAHLQDMFGFVRELRTMVSGLTEARFVDDRIR